MHVGGFGQRGDLADPADQPGMSDLGRCFELPGLRRVLVHRVSNRLPGVRSPAAPGAAIVATTGFAGNHPAAGGPPVICRCLKIASMIQVTSVNVARAGKRLINGNEMLSAIGKRPCAGRVQVRALGLEGDEQADLSVHGGLGKAVYAYPSEHYAFWQVVRAQARVAAWDDLLPPGSIGENLSLRGLLEGDMWIGDYLRLPHCTLAINEPRRPCFKFDGAMGFAQASKLMRQSGCCGAYLTVIEPGSVEAGDTVMLVPGPREVNLLDLFRSRVSAR
jgi:MOSC domain-containing protein YiiM